MVCYGVNVVLLCAVVWYCVMCDVVHCGVWWIVWCDLVCCVVAVVCCVVVDVDKVLCCMMYV